MPRPAFGGAMVTLLRVRHVARLRRRPKADRAELKKVLARFEEGDALIVNTRDRLGARCDLLNVLGTIGKAGARLINSLAHQNKTRRP